VVKRGDIWLVNLDPTIGSEIKKSRPCVVISPPELNSQLHTVMVAPMTTKGFPAPFRVPITLAGAKSLGSTSTKTMSLVLATLQEFFAD
jgi:mRNA interferase MazF